MACVAVALVSLPLSAGDDAKKKVQTVYPVAVFPFQERGRDVESFGSKVSDLLFANLIVNPDMYLVEREDLEKLLSEQELNISGLVNPAQATQVGQLTGAKIIITGSVLQVGDKLYVVAKIIGTETSRVLGASVKGELEEELDGMVEGLAGDVADTISQRADDLVPKPVKKEDRIAALKKKMKNGKRPTLFIDVSERHVGQATIDPAAETELTLYCKELGFEVIDPNEGSQKQADVLLVGEGFSQFAARHGNLTSVKARLEVKAVDRKSGRVLAVDRQTSIGVGLAEQIAGKSALQDAAADIAERILPKLVELEKNRKKSPRKR